MSANEFASYTFDAASRITGISQKLWVRDTTANPPTPATQQTFNWTLGYDNRNRLTSLQRKDANAQAGSLSTATSTYTYDANSNRLTGVETSTAESDFESEFSDFNQGSSVKQIQIIPPASNRLLGFSQVKKTIFESIAITSTAQVNYSLDANGNLTSDGLRSFEHDATNRLAAVKLSQSPEAAKVTYLHNALGLRVFKSEPQVAQTAPNSATLGTGFTAWLQQNFGWLFAPNAAASTAMLGQSYVYDEQANLIGEYGNGGANPQTSGTMEYIWLPTDSGQAIPIGLSKSQRLYAVHADHLGTPRLVTDDTKTAVWQWPYSGFGANKPSGILASQGVLLGQINGIPATVTRIQGSEPAISLNLRFPGQYFDQESNLAYNYFRSYQPTQGRYTQSDPIGLEGGWNRYAYVEGNAFSNVDSDGLQIIVPIPGRRPVPIDPFEPNGPAFTPAPSIPRDIWWPDKKRGQWVCKARADCNDNIPGNCPEDPKRRFAFGGGDANDLGTARNIAKANATSNLQCQPKHVSCKCTGPKGEEYSGGC